MDWADEAIILASRRQGEGSLILSVLSRDHGRHRGLVRGAAKSRQRGLFELGNRVHVHWAARLEDHLGQFRVEPVETVAALVMDDPVRLGCLDAAVSLAEAALPEREPHPAIFTTLHGVIARLTADDGYLPAYLGFELALLAELGFAVDLETCAVTGERGDLAFVSPRSGRAVSRAAAGTFADRLLILPRILGGVGQSGDDRHDVILGLKLTGYFLERRVFSPPGPPMPPARHRFVDRVARLAGPTTD